MRRGASTCIRMPSRGNLHVPGPWNALAWLSGVYQVRISNTFLDPTKYIRQARCRNGVRVSRSCICTMHRLTVEGRRKKREREPTNLHHPTARSGKKHQEKLTKGRSLRAGMGAVCMQQDLRRVRLLTLCHYSIHPAQLETNGQQPPKVGRQARLSYHRAESVAPRMVI